MVAFPVLPKIDSRFPGWQVEKCAFATKNPGQLPSAQNTRQENGAIHVSSRIGIADVTSFGVTLDTLGLFPMCSG